MTATLNENTNKLTIGNFTPEGGFDFANLPSGENFRTIYGTYFNKDGAEGDTGKVVICLLYTSPSPRDS